MVSRNRMSYNNLYLSKQLEYKASYNIYPKMKNILLISTSLKKEKQAKLEILSKILIFGKFKEIKLNTKNFIIIENLSKTENTEIIEYLIKEDIHFKYCHNIYPLFLFKASYKNNNSYNLSNSLSNNNLKEKNEVNLKENFRDEIIKINHDQNNEKEFKDNIKTDSDNKKEYLKEIIIEELKKYIQSIELDENIKYKIIVKQRFTNILKKDDILELAKYINFKVDLKNFEYSFMVQIIKNYVMYGMIRNKKYNFNFLPKK